MTRVQSFLFLLCAILLCSCATKNPAERDWISGEEALDGGYSGGNQGQASSGVVTAGEWRDLDNWLFWSDLMTQIQPDQGGDYYTSMSGYWQFYTNNRVAVLVTNDDNVPQRDVPVQLLRIATTGNTVLYRARTDNTGRTNLWIGLTQQMQNVDTASLALVVNGTQLPLPVSVTHWGEETKWNICTASVTPTRNIDIAFFVDATGSMCDEIAFLKADLTDIITTVGTEHTDAAIRTAALFYRDEGDEYVTKVNDFSSDLSTTVSFISRQDADGGGDTPEAVHTALEVGLQQLSWNADNSIRLVFMLLDAPPHHEDAVIASLHRSIPQYAEQGIRIIPIAASGVDKHAEFFLRFMAIATDGTYVFITNDSGVGGDHLTPTVGDYKVERLNQLIVRLINQYLQIVSLTQ